MHNDNYTGRIAGFFEAYAARFAGALKGIDDVEDTAAAFADCFIGANPHGVMCGKNDDAFRRQIPRGNELYRSLGTSEMSVAGVDSSRLDDNHYMAKVFWHSVYRKAGREVVIDFSVIYLLQDINDKLSIFAYITGDEQAVLKEHGLL